jgi:hypothetical protein
VTTKIKVVNRSALERYESEAKSWKEEIARREQQLQELEPQPIELELYEAESTFDSGDLTIPESLVVYENTAKPSRNIVVMSGMYYYNNGADSLIIHPDDIGDEPQDTWKPVE